MEETRARNLLYQQLVSVPHREYGPMVAAFRQAYESDPYLISRACAYLATGGTKIRDQADASVICLLQSAYSDLREAGRVILLGNDFYTTEPDDLTLPGWDPFRLFRVIDFIANSDRKAPRLMHNLVSDYTTILEGNPDRFDGVAILNRKNLKWVYTHYHIQPDKRAQAILFTNKPPKDSKLAVLKTIAQTSDPVEQARLVVKHKIPAKIAASLMPKVSPAVGVALIGVMTPQECLNSRVWVEQSGLLEIPEVRAAYTAKVAKATASAATAKHRKSAQGQDAGVQAAVEEARGLAAKTQQIGGRVLFIVDKSGSLEPAITAAIELGGVVGPLLAGEFMVVAVDTFAREVEIKGTGLQDWERGFRDIRAGGGTNLACGVDFAAEHDFEPDKIVLSSDGMEHTGSFVQAVERFPQAHVILLGLTGSEGYNASLAPNLERAGVRVDEFRINGADYNVYDQVVALLGGAGRKSLIERILETPMPHRRGYVPA